MNSKRQNRTRRKRDLIRFLSVLALTFVCAGWAMAQENPKDPQAPEAVACEAQPGFNNLDAITILVENEAAEQEDIVQSLNIPSRPVPQPPAIKAEEVKTLMRDFLRNYIPSLQVKVVPGEYQPPLSALKGSHALLQARMEVVQLSDKVWEQRIDLLFYRRVTVDRTQERLFAVVWQAPAVAQSKTPEQLPQTVKNNLFGLLREFECRYRKAGNR